jgi:selenocysteine lyase/cysteine desulfurase
LIPPSSVSAVSAIESEYLLDPGIAYLNTASVGPTPRVVLDRTIEAWRQLESNPVFMAYGDGAAIVATDRVRERAAAFLGCSSEELLITRGTTDAMNKLSQGIRFRPGDRVLTTNHEHEGGEVCWKHLSTAIGLGIDVLDIPLTEFEPARIVDRFAKAINRRTRVISVSHVLTTNGLRMPIAQIAALAKSKGILCIVDGAQAVGEIAVNVKTLGCDAYASSGHKWLMGPKGTGFLYISNNASKEIAPVEREGGQRFVSASTGMGCLPLVVGLGAAIDLANTRGMPAVERRVHELRTQVHDGLSKIPRLTVVSPPSGGVATGLVACKLPDGVNSRVFHQMLREKHSIVTKRAEPRFFNGIRLSAHIFNSPGEIDRALNVIRDEL